MASSSISLPKLYDELLVHPIMTSIGSLFLSAFISRSIYGTIDFRPILICVASDVITIGLDHFNDQSAALSYAVKTMNQDIISLFRRARLFLMFNAILLILALSFSPLSTWLITAVFITPALLWDQVLFQWGGPSSLVKDPRAKSESENAKKNSFIIKRIPGMKAVFIGIIRGCGTFAVAHSILSRSLHPGSIVSGPWTPFQIIAWSTINRTCHAIMADVRDFREDWELRVPTIPVLLKSVYKTQVLLTFVHALTLLAFRKNNYIIFGSLYATALVWALDENSPKKLYRLSFHSQTLVAVVYGVAEGYKQLSSAH